jgi:transcriptional regulator with XRE-family HTH domain
MNRPENDKQVWKNFGSLIRRLREENRMDLGTVAKHARAHIGRRGLSVSYLSELERGRKAPPRPHVRRALAEILDVPDTKLEWTAKGWTVLDPVEVLEAFPEHHKLASEIRSQGTYDFNRVMNLMMALAPLRTPKGAEWQIVFTFDQSGQATTLCVYRPRKD